MLNKLREFIRTQNMLIPGERVICAVSGGADSMALLWGMYLLRDKMEFSLEAAHFNHQLRGPESDRDAAFVAEFCDRFDIPLHLGTAPVERGEKGLEAAAREARYAFFRTLPGKIATAHTANDNAETLLLNMVRGSGLKGLGGITPVGENLIRPMLMVTRREVLDFLEEYHIPHVEDSTNETDQFLRNRLRHGVMPLLEEENPRLAESLSAMALQLRQDEACLAALAEPTVSVKRLREMPQSLRSRVLEKFLKENGIREPTRRHICLTESLLFSEKPSARADLPGGITVRRSYDMLQVCRQGENWAPVEISCPGITQIPHLGLQIRCSHGAEPLQGPDVFTVQVCGTVFLRSRLTGDSMRTAGGTKSLKKLYIDRKIPAVQRPDVPVLADEAGVLGVYGLGPNLDRYTAGISAVQFVFEKMR